MRSASASNAWFGLWTIFADAGLNVPGRIERRFHQHCAVDPQRLHLGRIANRRIGDERRLLAALSRWLAARCTRAESTN
jgi:hypothetical protein